MSNRIDLDGRCAIGTGGAQGRVVDFAGQEGNPQASAYSASKTALIALTPNADNAASDHKGFRCAAATLSPNSC